ncbi:MAG: hypothetical protein ABI791_08370 [Acidobacteriota bacterium]
MEMNWEYFEYGPVEDQSERVYVTLNRRGNFFMNRRAVEAIGRPDLVVLMYDRRRKTVGIAAAAPRQPGAFRLKRKEKDGCGGRVLYASNFCRNFGIDPDETLRFTTAEVDKAGVLVLDLNEVKSVRRS